MGRKPIPTALKIARGNPGKRPLPKDEPVIVGELADPPATFTAEQKKEWERIAEIIKKADLAFPGCEAVLEAYCIQWSIHRKAIKEVAKDGEVLTDKKTGKKYRNPYMKVLNDSADRMARFACEFGLTPCSKTKAAVLRGKKETGNPFENLKKKPGG